jgi:hypothetical protein
MMMMMMMITDLVWSLPLYFESLMVSKRNGDLMLLGSHHL